MKWHNSFMTRHNDDNFKASPNGVINLKTSMEFRFNLILEIKSRKWSCA